MPPFCVLKCWKTTSPCLGGGQAAVGSAVLSELRSSPLACVGSGFGPSTGFVSSVLVQRGREGRVCALLSFRSHFPLLACSGAPGVTAAGPGWVTVRVRMLWVWVGPQGVPAWRSKGENTLLRSRLLGRETQGCS